MDFILARQNKSRFDIEFDCLKSRIEFFPSNYCNSELLYHSLKSSAEGWDSMDISFVASINGDPQFVFLGFILSKDNQSRISFFDLPAVFIELQSITRSSLKKIFSYFVQIASTVDSIYLRDLMQYSYVSLFSEYLHEHLDNICFDWSTRRLINLSLDKSVLKSMIRKSYRSLINKGSRELVPEIYHSSNISQSFIEDFRELHIREAGRETRSRSTWPQQLEAVKNNHAFCIGSYNNGVLISAGYFITSDKHCYYGVSASRRDMFSQPVFHSLLWSSILYAKSCGLSIFEIDSNSLSFSSNLSLTDKEDGIRLFKSGFGGKIYPYLTIQGSL